MRSITLAFSSNGTISLSDLGPGARGVVLEVRASSSAGPIGCSRSA